MNRWINRFAALALVGAVLLVAAAPAAAQGLWYKEVEKDGRVYVFNTAAGFQAWEKSGEIGNKAVTMIGNGPKGETVVAENETAIDMYNFKHDRPGYNRTAPKPAPSAPPTVLRWGTEGELKFGLLLQAWYITDDSPLAIPTGTTTSSTLGNFVGANTFRLRRAEIKLNGKVNNSWGFEVMLDPSKAIVSSAAVTNNNTTDAKILQDLAITFTGIKGWELALGQKKITLTEEGVRSSSELDFAERSQVVRAVSDRRETGLFLKGDVGPATIWGSATNGTASNTLDDSNDTLNVCGRVDLKFVPGLNFGGSGCKSAGESVAHTTRSRVGGHARFNGGAGFPLIAEAEYYYAQDGQTGPPSILRRSGWYAQALYTIADAVQIGGRYDILTTNLDAQDGTNGVTQKDSQIKTWTFGVHWIPCGHDRYKNLSLKLDYFIVQQDNRVINGALSDSYNQFALAAQVAF